jgi:Fe-S-cluster containining protein
MSDVAAGTERPVLHEHRLRYLGDLRVHQSVFQARFQAGCSARECKGRCCRAGVFVDIAERDDILTNADLVRRHMEAGQQQDDRTWFDGEICLDPDFPSGRCTGTTVQNGACVFLDSRNLCVLHKASTEAPANLKPFFCRAYPLSIADGELYIDGNTDPGCCGVAERGERDVFDVCSDELRFMLGEEGAAELMKLRRSPV